MLYTKKDIEKIISAMADEIRGAYQANVCGYGRLDKLINELNEEYCAFRRTWKTNYTVHPSSTEEWDKWNFQVNDWYRKPHRRKYIYLNHFEE